MKYHVLGVRIPHLALENRIWVYSSMAEHRDDSAEVIGSNPITPTTGVSLNGKAACLHRADGGSIPSTPTLKDVNTVRPAEAVSPFSTIAQWTNWKSR